MRLLFSERVNASTQIGQTLIDVSRLLKYVALSTCLSDTLTACQVNKLQLADGVGASISSGQVLLLDNQCEDTVRATRRLIHIV